MRWARVVLGALFGLGIVLLPTVYLANRRNQRQRHAVDRAHQDIERQKALLESVLNSLAEGVMTPMPISTGKIPQPMNVRPIATAPPGESWVVLMPSISAAGARGVIYSLR